MSESESDALPLGDTPIYVRGDFLPYLFYYNSYFFNDFLPENTATSPNSFSIFRSLLYFATLSVLHGAPVLICPAFVATATSASVVSSVSPLLCDTTAVYPFFLASSIASNVSVNVPIWFNFINILLAVLLSIPFVVF